MSDRCTNGSASFVFISLLVLGIIQQSQNKINLLTRKSTMKEPKLLLCHIVLCMYNVFWCILQLSLT